MQNLSATPQAAGGDDSSSGHGSERLVTQRDESVADRGPRRHRRQHQALHDKRWQILEAMDGDI